MSISPVMGPPSATTMQEKFTTMFEHKGLSADTIGAVSATIASIVQSSLASGTPPDPTTIQTTIETWLEQDVEAGTLHADTADQVRSALDAFESQLKAGGGPCEAGGPPPGCLIL